MLCNMQVHASLIVVLTRGGSTARLVAKYRPSIPVLTVAVPVLTTDSLTWTCSGEAPARQCLITRGLLPLLAEGSARATDTDTTDEILQVGDTCSFCCNVVCSACQEQAGCVTVGGFLLGCEAAEFHLPQACSSFHCRTCSNSSSWECCALLTPVCSCIDMGICASQPLMSRILSQTSVQMQFIAVCAGINRTCKADAILWTRRLHCGPSSHWQCFCHQDCGHQMSKSI